jgi:3-deoxy-D-manno-octulosonic-acid transferase
VRTAIVNGQFADKGFRRARRALRLYRWALGNVERLLLQTERAAERARLLGAEPSRIRVVGSAKFEQQIAALSPDAATCLRSRLGEDAPILVAGSTHPGEEEQVLDAFRVARQAIPGLRLLLAPRHVGRADEVEHVVHAAGFRPARRSAGPGNPVDVLILDTMGELAGCYAAGRVAFLGGSLAPIGGHDLLQPLLQGCPVLFGPHMHNQRDVADLALEVGAASEVGSPPELASMVVRLATDECAREKQVRAGRALLARHAGAAGEYARELIRMVREAQASA